MKTAKITAIFTLITVTFSACNPIFANVSEEKLKEREKLQTERALILSEKDINLDDKEKELNKRSAELEALSKRMIAEKSDLSVRQIELDETKADLSKQSAWIDEQNRILSANKAALAQSQTELNLRNEEVARMETEVEKQLQVVAERQRIIDENLKEIEIQKQIVQDELNTIEIKKAAIIVSEDALKNQTAALEKREKELKTAQKIFDGKKQKLEASEIELSESQARLDEEIKVAENLKTELNEKFNKLNKIIELNEAQMASVNKLGNELLAKIQTIEDIINTPNDSIVPVKDGMINWSDGSIRAKGLGVAPENTNGPQYKALARRAAVVDLQRNLLETLQGVQIDSKTTVENLMLKSDVINTAIHGTIKGVEIVTEKWDEENKTYVVAGQIRKEKMTYAMEEIIDFMPKLSKIPREPKKKTGDYTGLILSVTHLDIAQQKVFHIVDEKGQPVYGPEYTNKSVQTKDGLCVYYENIVFTEDENKKVGNNPLVIRAQRIASNGIDIVIPNSEAEKIRTNKIDFRKDCKVIVVRKA